MTSAHFPSMGTVELPGTEWLSSEECSISLTVRLQGQPAWGQIHVTFLPPGCKLLMCGPFEILHMVGVSKLKKD